MPKRILLVDDEKMVRDTFLILLTELGFSVDTAIDGEDALNKLSKFVYDLVISDINMPKLNGIDLYHRAVKLYPYLLEKFILITGDILADLNTLSALKNKIILKSSIDEILEKVRRLLTVSYLDELSPFDHHGPVSKKVYFFFACFSDLVHLRSLAP